MTHTKCCLNSPTQLKTGPRGVGSPSAVRGQGRCCQIGLSWRFHTRPHPGGTPWSWGQNQSPLQGGEGSGAGQAARWGGGSLRSWHSAGLHWVDRLLTWKRCLFLNGGLVPAFPCDVKFTAALGTLTLATEQPCPGHTPYLHLSVSVPAPSKGRRAAHPNSRPHKIKPLAQRHKIEAVHELEQEARSPGGTR